MTSQTLDGYLLQSALESPGALDNIAIGVAWVLPWAQLISCAEKTKR